MIVFAADGDDATNANLAVARLIVAGHDVSLMSNEAIRFNLVACLEGNPEESLVFLMGHGTLDSVFGSDDTEALGINDSAKLHGRRVFAWACRTGARLGHGLAQQGVEWWGYDAAITAPSNEIPFLDVHAEMFRVARGLFENCHSPADAVMALMNLRVACDAAIERIDELEGASHPDAFSLYLCCNNMWQRLSLWLEGAAVAPLRHPEAPPAYIDL